MYRLRLCGNCVRRQRQAIAVGDSSVTIQDQGDLDRMLPSVAEAIVRGVVAFRPSYVTLQCRVLRRGRSREFSMAHAHFDLGSRSGACGGDFISYFEAARLKTAGAGAGNKAKSRRGENCAEPDGGNKRAAGQSKTVLGVGGRWFRTCGDNG